MHYASTALRALTETEADAAALFPIDQRTAASWTGQLRISDHHLFLLRVFRRAVIAAGILLIAPPSERSSRRVWRGVISEVSGRASRVRRCSRTGFRAGCRTTDFTDFTLPPSADRRAPWP